jgi:hypothetical protein
VTRLSLLWPGFLPAGFLLFTQRSGSRAIAGAYRRILRPTLDANSLAAILAWNTVACFGLQRTSEHHCSRDGKHHFHSHGVQSFKRESSYNASPRGGRWYATSVTNVRIASGGWVYLV